MNKIYRLIWSEAKEAWLVVSEKVKSSGMPSFIIGSAALMAAVMAGALPGWALDPSALPTGGQITFGSASISQSGANMTVNQNSSQIIANWSTFNIGKDASVQFIQPGASSTALNRISDQNPSQILGHLTANGQVFLLNSSGIIFGKTATVNVGGLVASAMNLSDSDFLANRFFFTGTDTALGAGILNQGSIHAADKGVVALIAPRVVNEGTMEAAQGTVVMAAGDQVTLDFVGDGLINVAVDKGTIDALADNKGLIKADGGTVVMTARTANDIISTVVNNEGVIEAQTIDNRSGRIFLLGDMEHGRTTISGTLDASAPNGGDGGFIETSAASVKVADSAKVTTASSQGKTGTWLIDPKDFTIAADGDMTGAAVGAALNTTDLIIQSSAGATDGDGDIFVKDNITKTATTGSATTLTLKADRNVIVNPDAVANTADITSTGDQLNVVIWSNSQNTGSGVVEINNTAIATKGGHLFIGGGPAATDTWNGLAVPGASALGNADKPDGVRLNGATIDTTVTPGSTVGAGAVFMSGLGADSDVNGGTGGVGVKVTGTNSIKGGNVEIIGQGGRGVDGGTTGGHGGVGIEIATGGSLTIVGGDPTVTETRPVDYDVDGYRAPGSTETVAGNSRVVIRGIGGSGGSAATADGASALDATGGDGGSGILVDGVLDITSHGQDYDKAWDGLKRIYNNYGQYIDTLPETHHYTQSAVQVYANGGTGGNADGGNGSGATGNGGSAIGGKGGTGLVVGAGSTFTADADNGGITLSANRTVVFGTFGNYVSVGGNAGGSAIGGFSEQADGGSATGGAGGHGIQIGSNATFDLNSDAKDVSLQAYGAYGGDARAGSALNGTGGDTAGGAGGAGMAIGDTEMKLTGGNVAVTAIGGSGGAANNAQVVQSNTWSPTYNTWNGSQYVDVPINVTIDATDPTQVTVEYYAQYPLCPGMLVTGPGIPDGTLIKDVVSTGYNNIVFHLTAAATPGTFSAGDLVTSFPTKFAGTARSGDSGSGILAPNGSIKVEAAGNVEIRSGGSHAGYAVGTNGLYGDGGNAFGGDAGFGMELHNLNINTVGGDVAIFSNGGSSGSANGGDAIADGNGGNATSGNSGSGIAVTNLTVSASGNVTITSSGSQSSYANGGTAFGNGNGGDALGGGGGDGLDVAGIMDVKAGGDIALAKIYSYGSYTGTYAGIIGGRGGRASGGDAYGTGNGGSAVAGGSGSGIVVASSGSLALDAGNDVLLSVSGGYGGYATGGDSLQGNGGNATAGDGGAGIKLAGAMSVVSGGDVVLANREVGTYTYGSVVTTETRTRTGIRGGGGGRARGGNAYGAGDGGNAVAGSGGKGIEVASSSLVLAAGNNAMLSVLGGYGGSAYGGNSPSGNLGGNATGGNGGASLSVSGNLTVTAGEDVLLVDTLTRNYINSDPAYNSTYTSTQAGIRGGGSGNASGGYGHIVAGGTATAGVAGNGITLSSGSIDIEAGRDVVIGASGGGTAGYGPKLFKSVSRYSGTSGGSSAHGIGQDSTGSLGSDGINIAVDTNMDIAAGRDLVLTALGGNGGFAGYAGRSVKMLSVSSYYSPSRIGGTGGSHAGDALGGAGGNGIAVAGSLNATSVGNAELNFRGGNGGNAMGGNVTGLVTGVAAGNATGGAGGSSLYIKNTGTVAVNPPQVVAPGTVYLNASSTGGINVNLLGGSGGGARGGNAVGANSITLTDVQLALLTEGMTVTSDAAGTIPEGTYVSYVGNYSNSIMLSNRVTGIGVDPSDTLTFTNGIDIPVTVTGITAFGANDKGGNAFGGAGGSTIKSEANLDVVISANAGDIGLAFRGGSGGDAAGGDGVLNGGNAAGGNGGSGILLDNGVDLHVATNGHAQVYAFGGSGGDASGGNPDAPNAGGQEAGSGGNGIDMPSGTIAIVSQNAVSVYAYSGSGGNGDPAYAGKAINMGSSSMVSTTPLSISGTGDIFQGNDAAIQAPELGIGIDGSAYLNGSGNTIGTFAFAGNHVEVVNQGALTIGSVGGLNGITATGTAKVRTVGDTADITLSQAVSGTDGVTLATGGNFINQAGVDALASSAGRWLVYSQDPAKDGRGGMDYDFIEYNKTYDESPTPETGNGFLYTLAPTVTIGFAGTISKQYDTTKTAALADENFSVSGAVNNDDIVFTIGAAEFDNKNVGSGKTVTVSDVALSAITDSNGKEVYGYQLAANTLGGNVGEITKAPVTATGVAVQAQDKVYDATTVATITGATLQGKLGSDDLSLSGSFADKNVGNDKAVTASLAGADAGNYDLVQPTGLAADITPATMTTTNAVAHDKVYDSTTAAIITASLQGILGSDDVALAGGGEYENSEVAINIPVTSHLTLTGTDAGNYNLVQPLGLTANIVAGNAVQDMVEASHAYPPHDNRDPVTTGGGNTFGNVQSQVFISDTTGTGAGTGIGGAGGAGATGGQGAPMTLSDGTTTTAVVFSTHGTTMTITTGPDSGAGQGSTTVMVQNLPVYSQLGEAEPALQATYTVKGGTNSISVTPHGPADASSPPSLSDSSAVSSSASFTLSMPDGKVAIFTVTLSAGGTLFVNLPQNGDAGIDMQQALLAGLEALKDSGEQGLSGIKTVVIRKP